MQAQLDRFLTALHTSGLDPRCIEQIERRLSFLLRELREKEPSSAVPASIRVDVLKVLADMTAAARSSGEKGPGCRAARKLLRFAGHCSSFADIARRAEQFRREDHEVLRAARERDLRRQAREIDIDGIHSVLEIRTSPDLESVGKTLHNCLANRTGSRYYEELRTGVAEFWAIRRAGNIIGILSIRTDTRELVSCLGDRNDRISVDCSTMLNIRHTVDATLGPWERGVSLFNRMVGA